MFEQDFKVFRRRIRYDDLALAVGAFVDGELAAQLGRRARFEPPVIGTAHLASRNGRRFGILTLEQAEEHLRRLAAQKDAFRRLLPVLGIRDRELTQTERGYVASWLDLGFEDEALSIAYDRTVTKTGKLSWPYMNKIILSWHGKGLHTPAEIEAGDGRAPRKSGQGLVGSAGEQKTEVDLDELRALRGKI